MKIKQTISDIRNATVGFYKSIYKWGKQTSADNVEKNPLLTKALGTISLVGGGLSVAGGAIALVNVALAFSATALLAIPSIVIGLAVNGIFFAAGAGSDDATKMVFKGNIGKFFAKHLSCCNKNKNNNGTDKNAPAAHAAPQHLDSEGKFNADASSAPQFQEAVVGNKQDAKNEAKPAPKPKHVPKAPGR